MCHELYWQHRASDEARKAGAKPKEEKETSRTPETKKPERTLEPA